MFSWRCHHRKMSQSTVMLFSFVICSQSLNFDIVHNSIKPHGIATELQMNKKVDNNITFFIVVLLTWKLVLFRGIRYNIEKEPLRNKKELDLKNWNRRLVDYHSSPLSHRGLLVVYITSSSSATLFI